MREVIDTMLKVKTIREMRRIRELQEARDKADKGRQQKLQAEKELESYKEFRHERQNELIGDTFGRFINPRELEKFNQELVALREKQDVLQLEVVEADKKKEKLEAQENSAEQMRYQEARNRTKFENLAEEQVSIQRHEDERIDEAQQEESEELRQARSGQTP